MYFLLYEKVFRFCTDKYYFLHHPFRFISPVCSSLSKRLIYSQVFFIYIFDVLLCKKRKPYVIDLRFFGNFFEVLFYGDGDDLFFAAGFDGNFCSSAFFCSDCAVCRNRRYIFV